MVEFRGSLEPLVVAAQEFASAAACLHSSFCSSRDAVSVPLHSQRICCTGGMSGAFLCCPPHLHCVYLGCFESLAVQVSRFAVSAQLFSRQGVRHEDPPS